MPETPAWNDQNLANPHVVADKARRVKAMFSAIAPSYDLNNRVHSMGRDQAWRRLAVKMAAVKPADTVLDVACGTGDLSLAFAAAGVRRVIGIDFTYNMLAVAQKKGRSTFSPTFSPTGPSYHTGDAMRLPVADASVDVVSIAFGIRNVTDPRKAIAEFYRVLRPGGRLIVLEFSTIANPALRGLYNFYFKHVMPRTATLIARDRSGAYKYLPQSVSTFITRSQMLDLFADCGFVDPWARPLTFGIAVIYRGIKR